MPSLPSPARRRPLLPTRRPISPRAIGAAVMLGLVCAGALAADAAGLFDEADVWTRVLLPLVAVAGARVADVTLGVLRTVLVVSGQRIGAAMAAAAETSVWLAAAAAVLSDLTPAKAVAYAIGVALGTICGMELVRKARWGVVTVRVFAPAGVGQQVAAKIREVGGGATVFDGQGRNGQIEMVLSMLKRREAVRLARDIEELDGVFAVVDTEPVVGSIAGRGGRV